MAHFLLVLGPSSVLHTYIPLPLFSPPSPQEAHRAAAEKVSRAIADALTNVPLINGAWCPSMASNQLPNQILTSSDALSMGPGSCLATLMLEMDRGTAVLQVSLVSSILEASLYGC